MARGNDYISAVREKASALWNALNELEELQKEWTALDYGNTLAPGSGTNAGISSANVGAVVFDAANAIRTVFNSGVATNIAKLL